MSANGTLTLYDYWRSSACYRVRIALNLKGLRYERKPIHLIRNGGEQHSAAYHEVNPQEAVPALVDGERTIRQSLAIIEYLDEAYDGTMKLLPTTARDRARALRDAREGSEQAPRVDRHRHADRQRQRRERDERRRLAACGHHVHLRRSEHGERRGAGLRHVPFGVDEHFKPVALRIAEIRRDRVAVRQRAKFDDRLALERRILLS